MKILLIEDEIELAKSIQNYFTHNSFVCEWVDCKEAAIDKICCYDYDCILLDLMLPDGDGIEILKKLRSLNKTEGVIIISAKNGLDTRIEGFNEGADDFLVKPFHLSELMVRVQALIRRRQFSGISKVVFNEIEIDVFAKSVVVGENEIKLTKKEYALLLFLIANKGRVLSKSAIAEHLSGDMADMLDNFDFIYVHMGRLKSKLKAAGGNDYIKTVHGLGYKWING
ncbi:response regulator transcription factor [Puteibacter caeruleilacunae]|nr:response regulator transcription factor [Puteibacter caeruleilacunae]